MYYSENDFLMLSNLQHFSFCKRRWSFVVLENQWIDNRFTAEGVNLHKNADDETFTEVRNDVIISRAIPIVSHHLGLSGKCDVVEFHKCENGVLLPGRNGKYMPIPVEYKRGSKKADNVDIVQLCAQALCFEEMLNITIPFGYLYYHKTRRREKIEFTKEIREEVLSLSAEMHDAYRAGVTFPAVLKKGCKSCSFYDMCLPESFSKNRSVKEYIDKSLKDAKEA